ncbi:uncharacterized protein LOC127838814 [Dreissena polymorpha]|uniref:PDZ domain-containing protein n=1 Tax=Dreissena polymorpha TaxID=45954 RepID=A0A9D4IY47_DREPO|nr:uncharacterized protein LOC127838814 [Dreissena polymorpha]KAH3791195.1 hypothetical protein DPMN_144675 [Dreissena polymorpha]
MGSAYDIRYQSGVGRRHHESVSHSEPNSARLSTMSHRPTSAIDGRLVHGSYGDLSTSPMDLKLGRDLCHELYKRYPHAFARRLKAREGGQKLLNARNHVWFQENTSRSNPSSARSVGEIDSKSGHASRDVELHYYARPRSRLSEDALRLTSQTHGIYDPPLTVTQKLKQNSQNLNALLNENSPLNPFNNKYHTDLQHDTSTDLQEYMIERGKERSRHRQKHKRIIIQRKINGSDEGNKENKSKARRWVSKSASPTSRNRQQYSLPKSPLNEGHLVNIDTLLAESDLKIDSVLERITRQMVSPDFPAKSSNEKGDDSMEWLETSKIAEVNYLPSLLKGTNSRCESPAIDSSPGSSASTCNRKHSDRQTSQKVTNTSAVSDSDTDEAQTRHPDPDVTRPSAVAAAVTSDYEVELKINEINDIKHRFVSNSEHINSEDTTAVPGILKVCFDPLEVDLPKCESEGIDFTHRDCETVIHENQSVAECSQGAYNCDKRASPCDSAGYINNECENQCDNQTGQCGETNVIKVVNKICENDDCEQGENVECCHGDNDLPMDGYVAMDTRSVKQTTVMVSRSSQQDSDLDSGIGCGSSCAEVQPGQSKGRQSTSGMRLQPVKADHSILPLRPDFEIPSVGMGGNSLDVSDDTNIRLGICRESIREKKVVEKYRRARTPCRHIIIKTSEINRPKSAPTLESKSNLKPVDIPISAENSDFSPDEEFIAQSQTLGRQASRSPRSVQEKYASTPNLVNANKSSTLTGPMHDKWSSSTQHLKPRKISQDSTESSREDGSLSESESDESIGEPVEHNFHVNSSTPVHRHPPLNYERGYNSDQNTLFYGQLNPDFREGKGSETNILGKKGMFKPAVSSPRVKEKRLKLRSILKNKKGSFNPIVSESNHSVAERATVNRIYAKDRGQGKEATHSIPQSSAREIYSDLDTDCRRSDSERSGSMSERNFGRRLASSGSADPLEIVADVHRTNSGSERLEFNSASSKNYLKEDSRLGNAQSRLQHENLPQSDQNTRESGKSRSLQTDTERSPKAQPPKKPARTKHKRAAPDLSFSKYKIKTPEAKAVSTRANGSQNYSSEVQPVLQLYREETPCSAMTEVPLSDTEDEMEHVPVQSSNLTKAKEMSASKSSLFDKTSGKLKLFGKSTSLEKGLDEETKKSHSKGGNLFSKMKKASSIKSITSLFKRKKKDKVEDKGSTNAINSNCHLSESHRKQWSSCHVLSSTDPPTDHSTPVTSTTLGGHPIGQLQKINHDGTQVVRLTKPESGPLGFYITKGNAKYGNGIFVSRFSSTDRDRSFAGLLGVGDEILEVNGHPVSTLSKDEVYSLICASPIIVLKVFPFIARKDV